MLKHLARPMRLLVEFIAAIIGILIIMLIVLIVRLNMGPISSDFFTPYLEKTVAEAVPGTRVSTTTSLLTWDNVDHSITLHAENVKLNSAAGNPIAEVPVLDVRISVFGLLVGKLMPSGLKIQHPRIWLVRSRDGTLLFGGMAAEGGQGGSTKAVLTDIADNLAHAHFMRHMQLLDAIFMVHDESTNDDWQISIEETELHRSLGGKLTGEAKAQITQGAHNALIVAHYNYEPNKRQHNLGMRFSGINPATLANPGTKAAIFNLPLSGEISISCDNALTVINGKLDMTSEGGTLESVQFWPEPRPVKNLAVKAYYDRKTGKLEVTTADLEFSGPKLRMTLTGNPPVDRPADHDFEFILGVKLDDLPIDSFDNIWPKPIIANARDWIVHNLSKGTFEKGEAKFKGKLKWDDIDNMQFTDGAGSVVATGGQVNFMKGMPQVTGVNAKGSFDLDKMTVELSSGSLGDLRLQKSTILLTGFQDHIQYIDMPLRITGPVSAALKLIDYPPLGYAKAVGLTPADITGNMDVTLNMKLPLLNDLPVTDIDVGAKAKLTEIASNKLLPGYELANGNLTLDLGKESFSIEGLTSVNKVPLNIKWMQAFKEQKGKPYKAAEVTGSIIGPQWASLGLPMLAKSEGPIDVSIKLNQPTKELSNIDGTLDMKQAQLDIAELGWKKPQGEAASAKFSAEMPTGKNTIIKSIEIVGNNVKIKGRATLDATTYNPVSVELNPFVIARTDAILRFNQAAGANGKMSFAIDGRALDISGMRGGDDPGKLDLRPKEFSIKLDKLYTSEYGVMDKVSGTAVRDSEGWSAVSLHGMADGTSKLDVELIKYEDGHREFSVRSDSFGKTLKGLGITDKVEDGSLKVVGKSTLDQPRLIKGKTYIGGFTVKDLPALVVLINATSPFGIVNLFTGTLGFDHMLGKFTWQKDVLTFDNIRAAGNSVGITVNGKVDMEKDQSDLNGTVAPFSVVNRILNYIPIIGEIITGGEGQGVLGVSYTIKGSLNKPDVSVNPASLLTPGFLRNIFFSNGSDDSDTDDDDLEGDDTTPVITKHPVPPAKTNITR